ncbi:hypothetical protein ABT008_14970 [Micromonospora sp. NPDC002389]|uniref:hypothetical protein n=1 Tax=Micromonospora sp. NPDC002389 TaxID=3154272 RepID=UPI00331C527B
MIEKTDNPISVDDRCRLASVDATMLQDRIAAAVEAAADSDPEIFVLELSVALLAVVQDYLVQTSNDYDLELFLEVNGTPPTDVSTWPVNILAGLRLRRTPSDDYRSICESAVDAAVRRIRSSS